MAVELIPQLVLVSIVGGRGVMVEFGADCGELASILDLALDTWQIHVFGRPLPDLPAKEQAIMVVPGQRDDVGIAFHDWQVSELVAISKARGNSRLFSRCI